MKYLELRNITQNNLKKISLKIPFGKLTVVTGPSGSGKTSLAFDTIYAEGQRRFIESLTPYVRGFLPQITRPSVEVFNNVPPVIALEQKNRVRASRGTVASSTEIYDLLAQIFAADSTGFCDRCGHQFDDLDVEKITTIIEERYKTKKVYILHKPTKPPEYYLKLSLFRALSDTEIYHLHKTTDLRNSYIIIDRIEITSGKRGRINSSLEQAFSLGGEIFLCEVGQKPQIFRKGYVCVECGNQGKRPTAKMFSFDNQLGVCPFCKGFGNFIKYDFDLIIPDKNKSIKNGAIDPFEKPSYKKWYSRLLRFCIKEGINAGTEFVSLSNDDQDLIKKEILNYFTMIEEKIYKIQIRVFISRYKSEIICTHCNGAKLNSGALSFRFLNKNFHDFMRSEISEVRKMLSNIDKSIYKSKMLIEKLEYLLKNLFDLGLSYITLERPVKTLSGGEYQRIRLGNFLSLNLTGILFILDEPTTGLHPKDIMKVIKIVRELASSGNTILVVEQNLAFIRHADEVLELGPKSGDYGGEVVFHGTTQEYLSRFEVGNIKTPSEKENQKTNYLSIKGIEARNIRNLDFNLPLNKFVCLTGVSGSGKSTLVEEIIHPALLRAYDQKIIKMGKFKSISGLNKLNSVVFINQELPTKTARSTVVTYINAFDEIRREFANLEVSKRRKIRSGDFSFNIEGGRCEKCKGLGILTIDMNFLGEIEVTCDLCGGNRFKKEILKIRVKNKNIFDILKMSIEEAVIFFCENKALTKKLMLPIDLGLGYLPLGLTLDKLSGGELQRLKMIKELQEKGRTTLYLFDEPSLGLGYRETDILMRLFNRLISQGHSILCIEHNLEIISKAEYIIDLGPEGGPQGGKIVCEGIIESILSCAESHTSKCLNEKFKNSTVPNF